jgi:2,3-bisphosphoglycerate-independent phosphoglycerate mutase
MSTRQVAKEAVAAIRSKAHRLVVVDFVAPDTLAHSRDRAGTVSAIEAVDAALGEIAEAAQSIGAALIVTSTHGNCEALTSEAGEPHPGHTDARVPLILAGDAATLREGGSLVDVAPTILELLGLTAPAMMTGRSLRIVRPG